MRARQGEARVGFFAHSTGRDNKDLIPNRITQRMTHSKVSPTSQSLMNILKHFQKIEMIFSSNLLPRFCISFRNSGLISVGDEEVRKDSEKRWRKRGILIFISVYHFIYLFLSSRTLAVCMFTYLLIWFHAQSGSLSACRSVSQPVCPFVCLPVCPSVSLSLCFSFCLYVYLFVSLTASLSACMYAYV